MDGDPVHADELLTAIILVQVVLTSHHAIGPSIHAGWNTEGKNTLWLSAEQAWQDLSLIICCIQFDTNRDI